MVNTVLIAIEDLSRRQRITKLLINQGYRIIEASSGNHTINLLRRRSNITLLLLDLQMSDINGLNFIDTMRSVGIFAPIIIISIKEDEKNLDAAIKSGADDFIIYPFSDLRLMITIKNTIQKATFQREMENIYPYSDNILCFSNLVAKSHAMQKTIIDAKELIKNQNNILIKGEQKTDRNRMATIIHSESGHQRNLLYNIQCRYSSNNQKHSQSWQKNIKNILNNITQGTVIFNNIENLNLQEQNFLFEILYALTKKSPNIRLIATTTPEIDRILQEGLFYKKLYKLFAESILNIPPLRDRQEDIADIAKNLLVQIITETGYSHISELSESALNFLSQYDWPGNILELDRVLFRALLISKGPLLSISNFPQLIKGKITETDKLINTTKMKEIIFDKNGHISSLEELERIIIKEAMIRYHGRISEVARRLKIGRSTLYRKLEELNIEK